MDQEARPYKRPLIYKRPFEVIDGAKPAPVGKVAWSIALAGLVMLLLGSKALVNWTNNLPISPVSDFLLNLALGGQHLATVAGLTGFSDSIRNALHALQALR